MKSGNICKFNKALDKRIHLEANFIQNVPSAK